MFGNYAAQAGVIAGKAFASVNIEWNFGNMTVLGFDPFPSNINDRPRINTFRSDATNLNYMSGGRDVLYPPTGTNGVIYQPWGDRRTGSVKFNIPLVGNTFAGVDVFVQNTGVYVNFTPPTGAGSWSKVNTIPGEDQYQYILKNGTNPNLKVSFDPIASFWDFREDPLNKTLSNFRIVYTNGTVIADWGDGNTSGINSNVNYNYTWGNYQSDNFYYVEGSGAVFDFNKLGLEQRMSYDTNNNYWVKYFGTVPQPVDYSLYYRFWDGTGGLGINKWWGSGFGPDGTVILSGGYSRLDIIGNVTGNFKLTFEPNTLQFSASASPRLETGASSYLVSNYQPIGTMEMDFNYYYDGWRYEKIFTFNENTGINFRFLFSGGSNNATYGDSNGDGSLEVNGNFISLNAISGRSYKFAFRVFELDYIPYEVTDLGII